MKDAKHQEPAGKAGKWTIPGYGLLQGLFVSGRNMVESYYKKERCPVIQYPEEKADISPNFRNFPFLCYDGDRPETGLRCTACGICEKECPPQCIYIVMDRDENGKAKKRPKVFDIDISVCMNCGICAEVCPFDSIYMDGQYEMATDDRFEKLVLGLDRLAKSTDYHMQLRPKEATAVMEKRKAAEEKKKAAAAARAAKAKAAAEKKAKEAKEQAEKNADDAKGGTE
ncbi:MAG: 4Fe-4S dicluster domain-containing protein [Verrucomicrobiales bacterium]|nr:4Fe-4S dicluster domain-containing protein [Verrucomicrobiota bacterium JB025]